MAKGAANNNREETDSILRVLLEAASELAATLDADGTYLELNSAAVAESLASGSGERPRTLATRIHRIRRPGNGWQGSGVASPRRGRLL